jgi:hypothetical protein
MKMAARHKRKTTNLVPPIAAAVPPTQFPGKDVMAAAKKGSAGFKKGGGVPPGLAAYQAKKAASKSGGMAEGGAAPARMDKPRRGTGGQIGVVGDGMAGDKPPRKARGGAATMRGRSPMSAACNMSPPVGKTTH